MCGIPIYLITVTVLKVVKPVEIGSLAGVLAASLARFGSGKQCLPKPCIPPPPASHVFNDCNATKIKSHPEG